MHSLYSFIGLALCLLGQVRVGLAQDDADPLPGLQGTFSVTLNATLFPIIPFTFNPDVSNYVTDWNIATQWVSRNLDLSKYGPSPPRGFALMHLAQWQALRLNSESEEAVDPNCLVAYVSHLVFNNLYPQYNSQAGALLRAQVQNFTSEERATCKRFSGPVVANLLSARLNDGSQTPALFQAAPPGGPPGLFEQVSDEPDLFSNYANASYFITNDTQIDVWVNDVGPPPVGSAEYDANFAGYAQYGRLNTSESIRSTYQTGSAYFWYATNGTSGSQGQWNQIALVLMSAGISLTETAEILARLNVASWDMYILVSKSQYKFLRWRPITAVRLGDCYVRNTSGCHEADPSFTPLLDTPNNPVYPSQAGGYAGAAEQILTSSLGGNQSFSVGSEAIVPSLGRPPRPRRYQSISQASREVCASRIYGGIDAPNDALAGRDYGLQVADYVDQNFRLLDPLSEDVLPPYANLAALYNVPQSP